MTQAYAQVLDTVAEVRRSWRLRRLIEGLVRSAAALVAVLTLLTLADHLLDFARPMRLALFAFFLATAGHALWHWIVRPLLAQHSDDFFAALIEQRHPQLRSRFINALQLGREPQERAPRLIEAIVADGAALADDVQSGSAVSSPVLRRNGAGLGLALLAAIAYLLLAGPAATTSLARVLMPLAEIAPFTWTRLNVQLDQDGLLLEGSPLVVSVQTSGRTPETARLHWTDAAGQRRAASMSAGRDRAFTYSFPAVESSFSLYATAGDGRSSTLLVNVEPRPRISGMSVTYTAPAYTALPPRNIDKFDGHLRGLKETQAALTIHTSKQLAALQVLVDGASAPVPPRSDDGTAWHVQVPLLTNGIYHFKLTDYRGFVVDDPVRYTITVEQDMAPMIDILRPGRDVQLQPEDTIALQIVAQDDYGLGAMRLVARINPGRARGEPTTLHEWPNDEPRPQRRLNVTLDRSVAALQLKPGDRVQYWATVVDRNNVTGPGRAESRKFTLVVLTPEQAQRLLERQLSDYAKVLVELIRLQRLNHAETALPKPPEPLIDRQGLIRRQTQQLAEVMEKHDFPGQTIIGRLRELASDPMAKVITGLEGYRGAATLDVGKKFATNTLPVQERIIADLEDILQRLNRNEVVRQALKKMQQSDPTAHKQVQATLEKIAQDLDKFLIEEKSLEEKFEKMPKRKVDEATGESLDPLAEVEHRQDRWKQWAQDTVDALTKLPQGFVQDSQLAENISTIFEEIDKKPRQETREIATPVEEGAKWVGTEVLEDLEMWMPDRGDSIKWTMEDPPEGTFEVPPLELPDNLQDMIGDLIEDVAEFDEEADDTTGSWGGNMPQAGWDIADGPISTFSAQGKTGNQLPNDSEITGRSGAGRRGKATGQMVGAESAALEGRPTPARVTNERYEEGNVDAQKQLDPRGATGGGKKTGGGRRGLQGGTPPDVVQDMQRMAQHQQLLRERAQQLAEKLQQSGRSTGRVDRAVELLKGSEEDLRDLRYDDAGRKRKMALSELRGEHEQIDQAVSLSLQKAQHLPADMQQQISAGSQQALPEGYEELVGAYYKALSGAGEAAK